MKAITIFYQKLRRNIQDYGLGIALLKTLSYAISPVYERRVYRVYRIDLDKSTSPFISGGNYTFKTIGVDDNDIINQIESIEEWLTEKLSKKLVQGDLCLTALDGEKVAAFNLIAFKTVFIPLISKTQILQDDEAWSEQITVHKDYRRLGLAAEIRSRVFEKLKKQGIKKLYGGALLSNTASLKLAQKVGFQFLYDIVYLKILTYKKWKFHKLINERSQES